MGKTPADVNQNQPVSQPDAALNIGRDIDRGILFEKHKNRSFTCLDTAFIVYGVGTYIADIVTDILACIRYFVFGDTGWGAITVVFVLVASVTVQAASWKWFEDDEDDNDNDDDRDDDDQLDDNVTEQEKSILRTILRRAGRIAVHVLQLATINR